MCNVVVADDVAYVVKDDVNNDFVDVLEGLGHNVDVKSVSDDFDGYDMLLIGDEDFSDYEVSKIPLYDMKTLLVNSENYYKSIHNHFGLTERKGKTNNYRVKIKNEGVITEGLDDFYVYNERGYVYYLAGRNVEGTIEVYSSGNYYKYSGIVYSILPGQVFFNNQINNERVLFFGAVESSKWSSEGIKLFENSVNWVLDGGDVDEDGLRDGNDNCMLVYNPGQEDFDNDGIGDLCDDDKDNDGYDNDCNDFNSLINPGAEEIFDNIDQNCVNDKPVLVSEISDITWNEDNDLINRINLNNYFRDYENDELSFSIVDTSSEDGIRVEIINGLVSFYVEENWYGEDWLIFGASDGSLIGESNKVDLEVRNVNDAPVLEEVNDVSVLVGDEVEIILNGNDVDSSVSYSVSGLFEQDNNIFRWIANEVGKHTVIFSVSDGLLVDSDVVEVNVLNKIIINEVSLDWIEFYNPTNKFFGFSNCVLENNDNIFDLNEYITPFGFKVFGLDLENGFVRLKCGLIIDEVEFDILEGQSFGDGRVYDNPTKGKSNDADMISPIVSLISPSNGESFDSNGIEFEYNVDEDSVCSLYLNDIRYNSFELELDDGSYEWFVRCDDGGNIGESEKRDFLIDVEYEPILSFLSDIEVNEGDRVVISVRGIDKDDDRLSYIIDDDRFSVLNEELNSGETFNSFWDTNFDDSGNYIVNLEVSDGLFVLEEEIRIKVKNSNLLPVFDINDVEIDEGSEKIIDIEIIDDGTVSINVLTEKNVDCEIVNDKLKIRSFEYGFGECLIEVVDNLGGRTEDLVKVKINAVGALTCGDNSGFLCRENEVCRGDLIDSRDGVCCSVSCYEVLDVDYCSVLSDDFSVEIVEPDDDDDFYVGDEIEVEVELESDDEIDLDLEVVLFDLDEEEEISSDSIDVEVDEEEEESLFLEVPSDIDESNDFVVFVRASNGECSDDQVEVDIKRRDYDLVINDLEIKGSKCNEMISLMMEVENNGDKDDSFYVEVLDLKSRTYEIEEGEKRKVDLGFSLDEGDYNLDVNVVGNVIVKEKVKLEIRCGEENVIEIKKVEQPKEIKKQEVEKKVEKKKENKITGNILKNFDPDCYGALSCIVEGGNIWYDVALGLSLVILVIGFVVLLAKMSVWFRF